MARLMFFHGAGGYVEDRVLADGLSEALGAALTMPQLPDEDMSYEAWAGPVRSYIRELDPEDIVVAHSFGASILLRVLAETTWDVPARATLLAMPDWGPDGWAVADYAFLGPEPEVALTLHHCRDDEIVDFAHLSLHAARLPSARLVEHPAGGHQFDGLVGAIAADVGGQ
ncbi:MAG: alpha/beta hydrolase [Rhodococcus sp. (in: high G+C Gram-positive bacteria)]